MPSKTNHLYDSNIPMNKEDQIILPSSVFLPLHDDADIDGNQNFTQEDQSKLYAKKWSQFLICLVASSVAFVTGTFFGYIGPTLPKLLDPSSPVKVTKQDIHLVSMIPSSSKILGPIIFTFFLNYIGRKRTAILTLLPYCLGNLLIYHADNLAEFAVGLYCMGVSYYASTAVSVYVVEVVSPHLRDTFGCFGVVQKSIGTLAGYTLATALSIKTNAIVMSILPLVIICFISWVPESPYFYLKKENKLMARKSLTYLYRQNYVEKELNRLDKAVKKANLDSKGTFLDMFKNPRQNCSLRSLILLSVIFFVEIFSGQFVFVVFFPSLLKQARPTFVSPELGGSFVTICQILTLFISMFLTRFFDKKRLMILSSATGFFPILALSIFYFANPNIDRGQTCESNIPLLCIILYFFTNGLGLANLPMVYIRELVPLNSVGKITFLVSLFIPAVSLLCIFTFNFVSFHFGYGFAFSMFAVNLLCGSIIFYFFLPETKNKTLENIQNNMIKDK